MKSTGSTTSRTFGARFADFLNVKDYGAKGDGSTDDRAAIQAAFDAAFGSAASPNGNSNRFLNRTVFFPAGNYLVGGPLYLTDVQSGCIFGEGSNNTRITYVGSLTAGNVVAQGLLNNTDIASVRAITPVIMTNGLGYSQISGLNLAIANSNGNQVGLYIFHNGAGTASTTLNSFHDMLFEGASAGVLIGYLSTSLCSEQTFYNCSAQNCTSYGFRNISQNALNNSFISCSAGSCDKGFSAPTGGIFIYCASLAGNTTCDIEAGQEAMTVMTSRTETSTSAPFIDASGAAAPVTVIGCAQLDAGGTGPFVSIGASSWVNIEGCVQSATNSARGKITGSGGRVYLQGNDFRNTSYLSSYTGTVSALDIPNGTVAALPSAAAKYKGLRALVTDANATTFMSTVAGSGANIVPVVCDGTNWKIG